MALRGVRDLQVVRRAVAGRRGRGGGRGAGRGARLAPPDAPRARRAQGLLALALHALRQVSVQPCTHYESGEVDDLFVSTRKQLKL